VECARALVIGGLTVEVSGDGTEREEQGAAGARMGGSHEVTGKARAGLPGIVRLAPP